MSGMIPRAVALCMKNKEGLPIHPSQHKSGAKEFNTSTGLTHPIHQYNNLGVLHLRMKKYALALSYFQTVLWELIVWLGIQVFAFAQGRFATRGKSGGICFPISVQLYGRNTLQHGYCVVFPEAI